jgi:hypothetical protein
MEETDTTQECIAAVLGVSRQRVGNVIGGNGPSQAQLQRLAEDPATCNLARAYVGRLMNTLDRRCPDRLTNDEIVEAIGRAGLNALAPFMRKAGGG